MPRKKAREAEAEEQKATNARLRYLLRNPDFRKDYNDLRRMVQQVSTNEDGAISFEQDDSAAIKKFLSKWGLEYISYSVLVGLEHPELTADTVLYFEKLFAVDTARSLWYPVVGSCFEGLGVLAIRVNLEHPIDLLLARIEDQLRLSVKTYNQRRKQTAPRTRQRLKEVDFYLQVYDLAEKGETFSAIADVVRKRPSTVKSAFLAASVNIFGPQVAVPKNLLPMTNFDPKEHCQKCSRCRKATSFKEMCIQARLHTGKVTKGQIEKTGYDTTEEAYRRGRDN